VLSTGGMAVNRSVDAFKALAGRTGMCPAAALLDPVERVGAAGSVELANGQLESEMGEPWQLPKRQLLECVCAGASVGGQSLLESLLQAPWDSGVFNALIDASNALDPCSLQEGLGERLLWVQVRGAAQLLRSLDLLLRDDNFALVAADVRGVAANELQSIPPFAWYRLQRLAHQRAGGCVIFSDGPSVRCADRRMLLSRPRSLEDLDRTRADLLSELKTSVRMHNRGQVLAV